MLKNADQIEMQDAILKDTDDYGFGMKIIGIGDMENDTF